MQKLTTLILPSHIQELRFSPIAIPTLTEMEIVQDLVRKVTTDFDPKFINIVEIDDITSHFYGESEYLEPEEIEKFNYIAEGYMITLYDTEKSEKLIGMIQFSFRRLKEGRRGESFMIINQIAVDNEYQNRGLGTYLLSQVDVFARDILQELPSSQQEIRIKLTTTGGNDAGNLYEKCGFSIWKIESKFGKLNVRMDKFLEREEK